MIRWNSPGKYGWNDNEDKQEFNAVIGGEAAALKMYKDMLWHDKTQTAASSRQPPSFSVFHHFLLCSIFL